MKTPNHQRAEVPRSKILDYLLALDHPDGAPKARFFLNWGFSRENWEELAAALIRMVQTNDFSEIIEGKFGIKYLVEAPIDAPEGRTPVVRTIWMISNNSDEPRLVTAYPKS